MRPIAFICVLLAGLLVPVSPGAAAADWAWPVHGQVVTEFRNGDDPYAAGQHRGIDIAAPVGTPVVAASAGTVAYAGVVGSSGLVVSERSDGGRYELSYLHLSSVAVRRGEAVQRGAVLGAVGVSGSRSAEQPHLHFGVREAGDRHAYLDPLSFLAPPPAQAPEPRVAPVPAPAGEPAPTLPLPVAVPAVTPTLAPVAQRQGPRPHSVPDRAPAPYPERAATPAPAAQPSAAPRDVVNRQPARHPADREPAARPMHGLGVARAAAAAAPPPRRPAHRPGHGGVDLGWLAACLGLVVAATLLAGPRGDHRKRGSARAAFGALVRAASRP